ncbi:MAG: hypothetical protein OEV57_08255, partial [Dehalococcoidia bacterium]|nr:hypothetical protein [Dehalococcoidia bacterium]
GRANIATLQSQVTDAERSVLQLQGEVARLNTEFLSATAAADGLSTILTTMETGRTNMYLDLVEIVDLAGGKANLGTVSHVGSSITVTGAASNVDSIYSYARALRESPRFSSVWVTNIGSGPNFQFSLTK